jgi:hypothetical protein
MEETAIETAHHMEEAALATGKNLLEKASHTVSSLKDTAFGLLHPHGWTEGEVPLAPAAPSVVSGNEILVTSNCRRRKY